MLQSLHPLRSPCMAATTGSNNTTTTDTCSRRQLVCMGVTSVTHTGLHRAANAGQQEAHVLAMVEVDCDVPARVGNDA